MRNTFFGIGAAYNEERDGPLDKYLEIHDGTSCFPLFHDYKMFKRLWDEGYLVPDWSVIRLMWNIGRGDEHFLVLEDGKLEGINVPCHPGRPRIHEPRKILTKSNPCWEAQHLSHNPKPRK